MTIKKRYQINN